MRLFICLTTFIFALSACNDQSRESTDSISKHEPLAMTSTLPSPTIIGPVSKGIRNQPWGSATESQPLDNYDYVEEEYFFEGSAKARDITATETGQEAFYRSRMIVRRPKEPKNFNGTVLVEWFNDSGFMDLPVMWVLAHEEILGEGYAYVGVSAQVVGVQSSPFSLKLWDPIRYGSLDHPGDEYAHDIFGQSAKALLPSKSNIPVLGPLNPKSIVAMGESQSCSLLSQYRNSVHQEHNVFDGYLLHSCNSNLTPEVSAPTILFMNESEVTGFYSPQSTLLKTLGVLPNFLTDIPGLESARLGKIQQENGSAPSRDGDFFRVWEITGGTHFDRQALADLLPLLLNNLTAPLPPLLSLPELPVGCLKLPNQLGMERPTRAALNQLHQWVTFGKPGKTYNRLLIDNEGNLKRDEQDIALGGIRLPTISEPYGANRGDDCPFIGSFSPFSKAELQQEYTSKHDYLRALTTAITDSINKGYLLPRDGDLYLLEAEQEITAW